MKSAPSVLGCTLLSLLVGCGDSVLIRTAPPGAQAYVDGKSIGRTPVEFSRNILRETNPMGSVNDVSFTIATAIRAGRLGPGMTKEQALIARGYPPAHRTPSLESNEWIFDTPGFVDRVVFIGGKIQSVTRGPAPE